MPGGSAITDEDGCVQTSLCKDADAVTCARVRDGGHRPAKAWVLDPSSAAFELTLAPPAEVIGRIEDPAGGSVAKAQVWFEAEDPDRWSAPPFVQMQLRSDQAGRFRFAAARPLPCDPCVRDEQDCELQRRVAEPDAPLPGTLWIRHPEHGLKSVVMPGVWGEMKPIVLDGRPSRVTGELRGQGERLAKVMIRHRVHRRDRQVLQIQGEGHFEFLGLGEGDYDVSVYVDGKQVAQASSVRPGDALSLDVE